MSRPRRSHRVLLAAAGIWIAILGTTAAIVHRGDVRGFFMTGTLHRPPSGIAGWPVRDGPGYDGQFFAVLATDPFLQSPSTPDGLDTPGYRAGRIGLPLAGWALALGDRGRAPVVYLVLSWVLALLGIWVASRWTEDAGRSPWSALPLAISGGMVSSMMRGTPDAAAASLVLFGLWLDERRSHGSTPVAACAALVRETSILGSLGIAVARWRAGRRTGAVVAIGVPALVAIGWRAWMRTRPGYTSSMPELLAWPLSWLPAKLMPPWTVESIAEAAGLVAVAFAIAACGALLPEWRRWQALGWAYAAFCALALLLGAPVYADRWAFARVHAVLPLLAVPLSAQAGGRVATGLLRVVPWAWAVAGLLSLALSTRLPGVLTRMLSG